MSPLPNTHRSYLCFIVDSKYHGFTALIEASVGGYVEVVNVLLAAGADINAKITWVRSYRLK